MKIERQIDVNIKLTVEEVAKAFFEMNDSQQAKFFNEVGSLFHIKSCSLPMQMQYVTDSSDLDDIGRYVMSKIGEYA
jgi:hypothetical protein